MCSTIDIAPFATDLSVGSVTSAVFDVGTCSALEMQVFASASEAFAASLQWQHARKATGPWINLGSPLALTTSSSQSWTVADCQRYVRLVATVSSGAPVSLEVSGEALQLYSTLAKFTSGAVRTRAMADLGTAEKVEHLRAGTDVVNSYLQSRYTLPLVKWGSDVRRACTSIALWDALSAKGFNPESPTDELYKYRYDQAIAWLKDVVARKAEPSCIDATAGQDSAGEEDNWAVKSDDPRGIGPRTTDRYDVDDWRDAWPA